MKAHEVRDRHRCVGIILVLSSSVMSIAVSSVFCIASAESSAFDRLRVGSEVPSVKPPTSGAERKIVKTAEAVPATRLIPASKQPARRLSVPLRGTVREYVASVVSFAGKPQLKLTSSGFVPCTRDQAHRCVAVVGDPCRMVSSEDCEGMYLTVVIDVDAAYSLDRAVGGGRYIVENQDDIEDLRAVAP
jgi:hypothetical protein